MEKIVEVCCGSYEDAWNAFQAGAKRIELNSALHLGGLTPSLATLILTKQNTNLKVITMIRPRGAGFCYTEKEFEIMKADAEIMMKNHADGIAFGCLDKEGYIHISQTKQMIDIVKKYGGEVVFHRAFDCVKDPFQSIEQLIQLGVDRVLTSGLEDKAIQGKDVIKRLQEKYGKEIEILAGSGINASNAQDILDYTGIKQVHSSCKDWVQDPTTVCHHVSYSYASKPHESDYDIVSKTLVQQILNALKKK